jgi:hypothetical protein
VGEYALPIPAGIVTSGVHQLVLRSDARLKFWYLLITPR